MMKKEFFFIFLLLGNCLCQCDKIPPNNHGIEPLVLIGDQEQLLVKGRMLAVIPRMSSEWSLSFTVKILNLNSINPNCNLIHFTQGGNYQKYGDRTPSVFLDKTPTGVVTYLDSAINGDPANGYRASQFSMATNVPTHFEIHQRYVGGGKYRFFIKINGQEVHWIINDDAQQFYNVKVYASNPWREACPGYIKNLAFTNFL